MAISSGFNRLDQSNLPGAKAASTVPKASDRLASYQNQELGGLTQGLTGKVGQAQPLRPSQQLLGMRSNNAVQMAQQGRQNAVKATNNRLMDLAKQNGDKRKEIAAKQAALNNPGRSTIQQANYGNYTQQAAGTGTRQAEHRIQSMLQSFPGLHITETDGDRGYDQAHGVARSVNSFHYDRNNPAVDIAGSQAQLWQLYNQLKSSGGWRQILWQVPGHYDHIHVA